MSMRAPDWIGRITAAVSRGKRTPTDWPTFLRGAVVGGCLLAIAQQAYELSPIYPEARRAGDDIRFLVGSLEPASGKRVADAVSLFAEASALVEQMHIEHNLDQDTVSRMIDGALSQLDAYSGFVSAKAAANLIEEDYDHRLQVGLSVSSHDGRYRVESVAPDSPAEKAGIKPGDVVVRVDGRYVGHETAFTINEMIKAAIAKSGEPRIDLGLKRPGISSVLNVIVAPADIDPVQVYDLGVSDGILHLYLSGFYPGMAEDAEELIVRAMRTHDITGVVLDLRNNGGGLTDEAMDLAELFLPSGSLLYETSGRAFGVTRYETTAMPRFPDLGLAVIVNGNSASASEIIAGALQAHDRARVVGWTTTGKGTVQRIFPVEGGAIKITFAAYRDGGLRKIQDIGVHPNIPMQAPDPKIRPSRFDKDTARSIAIDEARASADRIAAEKARAAARKSAPRDGDGTQTQ